ncbi:MAG TPA: hypothetical protein VFS00_35330, partial [Polyangiaceae bacterium]|nr:hypothetical protein [Polyangiaceae bacterium]
ASGGALSDFSGLAMEADAATHNLGTSNIQKKHLSVTNEGTLNDFSGLAMEADIVSNDLGPDNVQKKH